MIGRYTRSFLDDSDREAAGGGYDYDVVTELWFADSASLAAFWRRIREPDVLARIRADEAIFLQSDRTRMFEVTERGA